MLVVVPALTWIGNDPTDDPPRDGVINTLSRGGPVAFPRPLYGQDGHGLPIGFTDETAPFLIFLDRAKIRYDVTSDLGLTQRDFRLSAYRGVFLAGSMRWVPASLGSTLREYVRKGGRLASFGQDTLRRSVKVGSTLLTRPSQPSRNDPFGTQMTPLPQRRRSPYRLVATRDSARLGLLKGSAGELSICRQPEEGAEPLGGRLQRPLVEITREIKLPEKKADSSARLDQPRAAVAAVRFGRGLYVRVGCSEWGQNLRNRDVSQITWNIADILRGLKPQPRTKR